MATKKRRQKKQDIIVNYVLRVTHALPQLFLPSACDIGLITPFL